MDKIVDIRKTDKAPKSDEFDYKSGKLCKIVYFDESSVTDFIQIMVGGNLNKTTELLEESGDKSSLDVDGKATFGIGTLWKALIKANLDVTAKGSMDVSFNTNHIASNIVTNTILTDFIDIIEKDPGSNGIKKFVGYTVSAPKESMSYIALLSPYLSMLKSGTAIPAGEFSIAADKLDNTIKSAKGYYDFLGTKHDDQIILRFNMKAFKNNYKVTDLLKMHLSIYAIKVGKCSLDKLDVNSELSIDPSSIKKKDNPSYSKPELGVVPKDDLNRELDVYDVLLAGVETND